MTTVDRLKPGASASVVRIEGDDAIARRLNDLGFWPGTLVELVRKAPFGDPLELALRGYRLALRKREAARIVVEVDP